MPKYPHWYTLRKNWNSDNDFIEFVKFIRLNGYPVFFGNRKYIYFNINGFKYWTMGCPINNSDGSPCTILINRAKINYNSNYDKIAGVYDTLFNDEISIKENAEIMKLIPINGKVLDVGCGTGLFYDLSKYKNYIGIDPSIKMLSIFKSKYPDVNLINSTFGDFYSIEKFDTLIALFGVGSYLTKDELNKTFSMINENGKIFIMLYKEGYYPETYKKTGIENEIFYHDKNGFNKYELGNFTVYTNYAL